MQRKLEKRLRSDEEVVKDAGFILDFDEMARKGSMSREELSIAKWYGIYQSRQPGNHMMRVVIPGGRISSVRARALAALSEKYAAGLISFTTRQCAQFHRLQLRDLPRVLRDLQAAGMTSFHGCGDVTRNVSACPWASICPHRRLDVLPFAEETSRVLSADRGLDNLPRKFKITYSGCAAGCGQPHINCVGLVAVARRRRDGAQETGFRVGIGGGLGWRPFTAQTLYTFVPAEHAVELCRAVGVLLRDHGDRRVRMHSRLKFVVHRLGIDRCRAIVDDALDAAGVDRSGFDTLPFGECAPAPPESPMGDPAPRGDDGLAIQRIMIPKGEMAAAALARIAELSEIYGDKHVHATNRQNLELHGVRPERLAELRAEIGALGFAVEGFHGLRDVVTCVGTTYCPLAVGATHALFDRLQAVVHAEKYASIGGRVLVNLSGCPNSCSQYIIADVGFRGMRIREMRGSVEGYQVILGGTEDAFGEVLGEFRAEDCVRVLEAVLDTYLAAGTEKRLAAHVRRVGLVPYRAAVAALNLPVHPMAENPAELSVREGFGETAGDLKTLARDIPCQTACPAKTNVPEYIRHIALGDLDAAHRINQEDNVFPGVLGRVCTRPCESNCRYQWTSTRGPVRICSLKRAAADGASAPPRPLPAWFGPSGKRVAVVGGGPAGLTAARELKRCGHEVTVFDAADRLGGQMRAIPAFRLPPGAVDADIAAIVDGGVTVPEYLDSRICIDIADIMDSGLAVRLGARLDADGVEALRREFDAVLLAAGASRPMRLDLEGLPEDAGIEGLDFMMRYNADAIPDLAPDVAVIGGGFTAVDCARAARRLVGDAGRVSILYRRGTAQMAASEDELRELHEERVAVETLVTPVRALVEDGRLSGIRFQRTLLGEPEPGGKPRFIPVPGSEFDVPCRSVIFAIGQSPERGLLPAAAALAGGCRTSAPDLFVAGDYAGGSGDVIHAVAGGKAAAEEMDAFLMGVRRRRTGVRVEPAGLTDRTRDHDLVYPPPMPVLPPEARGAGDEVERGFPPETADTHAWRCYLCNHKFEIDQDKCIHCDWCIRVSPRDCIRRLASLERGPDGEPLSWEEVPPGDPAAATYIWIDSDNCIRCGNCISICPVGAISLRKTGRCTESRRNGAVS